MHCDSTYSSSVKNCVLHSAGGPTTNDECANWKWAIRGELATTRAEFTKKLSELPDIYCARRQKLVPFVCEGVYSV